MIAQKQIEAFRRVMKTPADPDNIDSIDWDFCDVMAPLMQSFTNYYFRLEVEGLEQVPHGPALVVGNHNFHTQVLTLGERSLMHQNEPMHNLSNLIPKNESQKYNRHTFP